MAEPSVQQIRSFRLRAHHLDRAYQTSDAAALAGACGMQNTPPGAWETALHARAPGCGLSALEGLLYRERTLLQAWSFRGTPVVFPTAESAAFLSALCPEGDEPWLYTNGIGLALDFLGLSFDELLTPLTQVAPKLNGAALTSKTALDQTLAGWMEPLLPAEKRALWNSPSMYGSPDRQTVGGAAVSFLLRPCALRGLVVFGERAGSSPTFTSYRSWTGHGLEADGDAGKKLARKYLHCYGPATPDLFAAWLGCSGGQARRVWAGISEEMEPVTVFGKTAYILSADRADLFAPAGFGRGPLLLGGHDPYLDQRDRAVLQPEASLRRQIWQTVSNPGAIVSDGEVIGVWTGKKRGADLAVSMTVWTRSPERRTLCELAEAYAAFRRQRLVGVELDGATRQKAPE